MAEPPSDPTDDDLFDELLSKRGTAWLTEALKTLGLSKPDPSSKPDPLKQAGDGIVDFLKEALGDVKAENKTLRERAEAMRELLTPEQLILLKSPKKENEGGPANPTPPPAPPKNPPGRGFLKRL